ncbi:Zn-ribbon domain-containing OB-fold protein [Desulfoscipio gibsoniae]|uniref:Putative nucleic-acid-binding protein containing a Zn-ribbon n=1 Tax=Desulfoscipio gibsoniae DSM 7213 TaxID=767817 RepID=R4KP51_9FIRM|nr:Zn-ribbon domain-containing OB-fold protein [Desulfoscipio gibsoniae]AGL01411.1 putative nucleic-acid-binding protein containing a Zn-ribbon [Desulfoscipio gibsoniae DSM 7213]
MGFEKFGRKSFASQTKVESFVEYLAKGELSGTQCKSCGKQYFPPRADCAECLGNEMDWFKIEGTGNLVSFTKAGFAPTGFEADVPYTLALADFNGIKVFGRLDSSIPKEEVSVGMALQINILNLPDGQLSYEFVKS